MLTWRGVRNVRILDKRAVISDMWKEVCGEFKEQKTFLVDEVGKLRAEIDAEKKEMDIGLMALVPGYFGEELKSLGGHLDGIMNDYMKQLPADQLAAVRKLREALGRAFDERRGLVTKLEKESEEHMDKLRRRLLRMAKDLEMSETEIEELRQALAASSDGVPSIYSKVQGLSLTEKYFEKKKSALKKLLDYNLELREKFKRLK